VLVTFEQVPVSLEYLRNAVQVGLNFIEVVHPTAAPSYTISSTCTRFPSSTLSTALLSEVQHITHVQQDMPPKPMDTPLYATRAYSAMLSAISESFSP